MSEDRELTTEECAFRDALFLGETQARAYEIAYGKKTWDAQVLRVRASQKAAEPHIKKSLAKLRAVSDYYTHITRESRIADELAFAQRCEDAGNFGAAGMARDRVNKLRGLYTEQLEVTVNDEREQLRELEKLNPKIARAYAKKLGIPWSQ